MPGKTNFFNSTSITFTRQQSSWHRSNGAPPSKVADYLVSEQGFFSKDLNLAAGIPDDFKISRKAMDDLIATQTQAFMANFVSIDPAKSLKNAYKIFSQLIPDEVVKKDKWTMQDLEKIPIGFDFDENTFRVIKKYENKEKDDFLKTYFSYSPNSNIIKMQSFFSLKQDEPLQAAFKNEFQRKNYVDKGEVLMKFLSGFSAGLYFLEGQTSIMGKLDGLDKNMGINEIKELKNFINNNEFKGSLNEFFNLLSSDLSIEDFKKEYLRYSKNKEKNEDEDKKIFKPIVGKSLNTNADTNIKIKQELLKKLLENNFDLAKKLELLFGENFQSLSGEKITSLNNCLLFNSKLKILDFVV